MLLTLGLMTTVSAVLAIVTRRLNIPSILLYMIAGLALGPGLGWIDTAPAGQHGHGPIDLIGEVGIALLLFLVGLELSFDRIRDVGPVAVVAGLGQVAFTAAFGFVLASLLGYTAISSLFIAVALTFSSTVVVVKLLAQRGDLHALYGRIAVGIFLVQDLVVIVALTVLAGLTGNDAGAALDLSAIGTDLALAFAGMSALLVFSVVAAKVLLPIPFAWMRTDSEGLLIWSIAWCFALVLAAERFHVSPEIGAFLAGVSLAQLPVAHDLMRRVHPLMTFFIAVFFVNLGASMELQSALQQWPSATVLSLFVLIGNPFIFLLIIARFGYNEKTAFQTSVTVAQISEFSFIFTAMGISAGLIEAEVLSVVAFVGLVTIAVSTYMILYSDTLYDVCRRAGLLRVFRAKQTPDDAPVDDEHPHDHVVVVGLNELGRRIALGLHARGERVVAIDTRATGLEALPFPTVVGDVDHPAVLQHAGVLHARLVISALRIEPVNHLLAWRCEQAGVPTVINAFDRSVCADLQALGVDYILDTKAQSAAALGERLAALRGAR